MPLDAEPIEYFLKFFTEEITDIICKEINRYVEQYIKASAANLRPKSVVHYWKPTNRNEIKAFLRTLLLDGHCVLSLLYQCFGLQIHFMTPLSLGRL